MNEGAMGTGTRRVLGVLRRVLGVPHRVLGGLHRVLGVLQRVLGLPACDGWRAGIELYIDIGL